jgi:ketosteroid isomerase-like protein
MKDDTRHTMSQQNVDIARRTFPAFNRGDVDGFLECIDPDVEWIPIMAALEGRVYRGHEGVRRWMEDLKTDWEVFEVHPEKFHDLGDQVLVLGRWRARARGSGVELEDRPGTWLLTMRDRKVVWMQTYTDRAEALEAAGVSEQDLGE